MNKNELLHIGERNDAHEASVRTQSVLEDFEPFVPVEPEPEVSLASLGARIKTVKALASVADAHTDPHDTEVVAPPLHEKAGTRKEIKGIKKMRYHITGNLWSAIGYVGIAIFTVDHSTGHWMDTVLFGLPDVLGGLGAFSWYHGQKQLEAARAGYTTRDLTIRGTFREIGDHTRDLLNRLKGKIGWRKKKDLRAWKN